MSLLLWKAAHAGKFSYFWKLFCCGRLHILENSLISGSSSAVEGCTFWETLLFLEAHLLWKAAHSRKPSCFWKLICCGRLHVLGNPLVSGSSSAVEGCTFWETLLFLEAHLLWKASHSRKPSCFWKLICCGRLHILENPLVSGSSSAVEGCMFWETLLFLEAHLLWKAAHSGKPSCFWKLICCGRLHILGNPLVSGSSSAVEGCMFWETLLFLEAHLLWKAARSGKPSCFWKLICCGRLRILGNPLVSGSSSAVEGCTFQKPSCFWKLICCGRLHILGNPLVSESSSSVEGCTFWETLLFLEAHLLWKSLYTGKPSCFWILICCGRQHILENPLVSGSSSAVEGCTFWETLLFLKAHHLWKAARSGKPSCFWKLICYGSLYILGNPLVSGYSSAVEGSTF